MWDKGETRIPFHENFVMETAMTKSGQRTAFVDVRLYDYPAHCPVTFIDGEVVHEAPKAQTWDTISSAISSVAVAFYPEGNGFYPWPHILLKASPSKILQGHNVFGTENIKEGTMQMFALFKLKFPKVAAHLDWEEGEFRCLDSTYSSFISSEYQREKIISSFDKMFSNKDAISRNTCYIQGNKFSEYRRQKLYYKLQELIADRDQAIKQGHKEKAEILGNKDLLDFAHGRMRFEATTLHRAMDEQGIPRKIGEFFKFHDWFEEVHNQPLAQYLWHKAFDKYFAQLEGHTVKNVDDDSIKLKIDAKYITIKENGSICRRKAKAIWRTYRDIKAEGYSQLVKERSSTFARNVNFLIDAGLSRAFLKSLDPKKPNENVIALVNIIDINFSTQRPHWYVEPKCGFHDERRLLLGTARPKQRLKLVA